jgi:hypothetical protein
MTPFWGPAALALTALAGCAAPRPLSIVVHASGGQCRYSVADRTFTFDALMQAARHWRGRPLEVTVTGDAPYRCVGSAVFALQRAGAARIGYVSEPPPAEGAEGAEVPR